jgi:GNAT superfamily N-acetyltransferase
VALLVEQSSSGVGSKSRSTMKTPLSMLTIRPAEVTDSAALFSLASAFATSFSVEQSAFESSFGALLQSPDAFMAVASDSGRIVGYVLGFDHHTFYANGRVAWIEEIMVSEDFRRRGVGRQLMESFEKWARSRHSKLIGLATRRAALFYRSLGYDESATYFRRLL